ncbi:MAG TPA: RIP metalloprotease RseP, partial [Spirochaetia bacterium]|nr:RIP metalloprotease RseP [Spirochaetia bacterium]
RGGTVYQISWFPIGGFCKMKGEITPGVAGGGPVHATANEDRGGSFNAAPPWRRIVISAAGPVFNLVFAAIILSLIWWAGFSVYSYQNRIVLATDYNLDSSTQIPPANAAGLKTGDRILAIDGEPIESYQGIQEKVSIAPNKRLTFSVARSENGTTRDLSLAVTPFLDKDSGAGHIGILPWIDPVVDSVAKGSAGLIAGIQKGDRIVRINGKTVSNIWDLLPQLSSSPGKVIIDVQRQGAVQSLPVVYERGSRLGPDFAEKLLGIGFAPTRYRSPRLGLPGAVERGLAETWSYAALTVKGFGLLFQGINLRNAIAGPLKITYYIGSAAASGFQLGLRVGLVSTFQLLAFLSVVLFLMNLLPIPAMDGGQIVIFLVEVIRGKAVPTNLFWRIQIIGFTILIGLIAVVTLNDILSFPGR